MYFTNWKKSLEKKRTDNDTSLTIFPRKTRNYAFSLTKGVKLEFRDLGYIEFGGVNSDEEF
jgi:hypothetical protein